MRLGLLPHAQATASAPVHLLGISGSLRRRSSNTALLRAAALVVPAGVTVAITTRLGELPYFNPDLDVEPPPSTVAAFRAELGGSDGLIFSSPEYAHGMPGTLKNALDWGVSGPEFVGKPVALLNASPRAVHADRALREVLGTMSAVVVAGGCVALPLLGRDLDAAGIASDPALAEPLRSALDAFAAFIRGTRAG